MSAADGYHVWSKTFDRELTASSRSVVEALKVRLMPGRERWQRAVNPEVYNEYLLGRQLFHNQRLRITGGQLPPMSGHWRSILISLPRGGLAETTFSIVNFAETSGAIT